MAESAAAAPRPFQYVLCAATSPAVKQQDESLTYLNQGERLSPGAVLEPQYRWRKYF